MRNFVPVPPPRRRVFALLALLFSLALLGSPAFAVDVNRDCATAYGTAFVPVTGTVTKTVVSQVRPLKGILKRDPAFGTCLFRATDHALETNTSFARTDYSRRQAFNADNTRFLVYGYGGSWHLYDATTLTRLRTLAFHGTAEPQWHATDPKSLYFLPSGGGMTLSKLNVETNTSVVVANFSGRLPWSGVARVWTRGEGSPSADSRYWCFMAETANAGMLGVFTYDVVTNTIVGKRSMSVRPNHVSMSPSGRYCVISDTTVWNPTFTSSRLLYSGTQHNDLALGADGKDYYVYPDQAGNGYITMVSLETGARTPLIPTWIDGTTTSMHISTKAFARPGWLLVSTYNHSGALKWAHEQVMAVEMKANPKIVHLVHHRTYLNGYWTQPHATVSRDFSRVLFNSNWGSTSSMDVDTYLARLSGNALGATSTSPTTTTPSPTPTTTGDTTAPNVTASVSIGSGSITMNASASDNVGVTRVEFYIDGVKKGYDTTSAYNLYWNTSTWWPGSTHTLVAKAYDAAGNVRSSTAVSFRI